MIKKIERKTIVLKKLKEIEKNLEFIQENLPKGLERFEKEKILKYALYKQTEFILQSMIDICAVINADLNLGVPQAEEDFITNMAKAKFIDEEMAIILKEMKGFRNILVHEYGEIDDARAFTSIELILKKH